VVRADVAGKTGTTQDNADGWFLMMHPHLVAGSWVGFDDPRVTFRSDYWGQGSHNALYVVGDFYRHALRQGQLDPRPTFGPAPEFERERPFFARVGTWLGDAIDDFGGRLSREDEGREDVRRARFKPEPEPEPRRDTRAENRSAENQRAENRRAENRRAGEADRRVDIEIDIDDIDIDDLARDLRQVLREVDRNLEGRHDEVGEVYREHVERYVREAERFLRDQGEYPSRLRRHGTRERREVEQQVRRVLDRYADDLSPRQRAQIRDFLNEVEGALR
jgi:penicillin-binding protein 1A